MRIGEDEPAVMAKRCRRESECFFCCCCCWQVSVESDNVMPMEMLPINNNGGQGYGFILYRTELWKEPWQITIHDISDSAQVTTGDAHRKCIRFKKGGRNQTRSY